MKTVIVALNSKYIHASLAPWCLKVSCGEECGDVKVLEFSINDRLDSVFSSIYMEKADVAAFSCYIWNIDYVLKIVNNLKLVDKDVKIVLGGPEVSFDSEQILKDNPCIDFIIKGEGERVFKKLLKFLIEKSYLIECISGLAYREGMIVKSSGFNDLVEDLDGIPSPYIPEMTASLNNRLVYFESSRGCPFSCSYCISSTFEGVRYFSMERVKADLIKLVESGVNLIKFVDRTFNCNRARAKEIFRFIIKNAGNTGFHFEAAADLFDNEMFDILAEAPPGLIQFEIGVQTTNIKSLEVVKRKTDLEIVFENIKKLISLGNIHIHLDLIAGLPLEDYHSFRNSFNKVYELNPHQLQLGFLKMLKGSKIRQDSDIHGYQFRSYPPYEFLCNNYIRYDEIIEIKGVEELLDRYFNSGRFIKSLRYLISKFFESSFDFYRDFYLFLNERGYYGQKMSSRQLYSVLVEFVGKIIPSDKLCIIKNLLKLDFLSSDNSNNLPEGIERQIIPGFKEMCFEFLKQERNMEKYLPEFIGVPPKQVFKQVHFEIFDYDVTDENDLVGFIKNKTVVLFRYNLKNKITELYNYTKIKNYF